MRPANHWVHKDAEWDFLLLGRRVARSLSQENTGINRLRVRRVRKRNGVLYPELPGEYKGTGGKKPPSSKEKIRIKNSVIRRDTSRCWGCWNEKKPEDLFLSYIIRRSKGGSNGINNFRVLCQSCKDRRGEKVRMPSRGAWTRLPLYKKTPPTGEGWQTNRDRSKLYDLLSQRDGSVCFYCWDPITKETATFDHYVSRAVGGRTSVTNLRLACSVCNERKKWSPGNEFYISMENLRSGKQKRGQNV